MRAFIKYLWIQFKMYLRNKGTLLTYYFTPLLFFFVMGAVFSSTSPMMKSTLAAAMTIFSVLMGSLMGAPLPLVNMRESGTMRAFKVAGIPSWATLTVTAVSAFLHLFIVSLIIYAVSPIAFHSDLPAAPGLYFAVLAVFLFTSVGVGMLIGVCAPGQSYATMLSMIVFLPSLLLSGIMFPTSMLPQMLAKGGRIFPATYALQAFRGYAYRMNTEISPVISLCTVAGIGLLMFFLASWRLNQIGRSEQT